MYATLLVGTGSLAGLIITVLLAGSCAPLILGPLSRAFTPHMHWILWSVIVFLILSEWPKTATHARQGGWCTLAVGLSTPAAGLLTFLLSGLLGFILRYRTPVNTAISFQNLGPAFIGLFAVPWLLQNMVSRGTGYFYVEFDAKRWVIDWSWIDGLPVEEELEYVRHVHLPAPLTVSIDGRCSRAMVTRPDLDR